MFVAKRWKNWQHCLLIKKYFQGELLKLCLFFKTHWMKQLFAFLSYDFESENFFRFEFFDVYFQQEVSTTTEQKLKPFQC